MTRLPAATEPVKETLSTPGWPTRYSLTSRSAGRMLSTPSGSPASVAISARMYESRGVSGEGLRMTAQPASSAGPSLAAAVNCGTFHGTTAATTPTGSRRTSSGPRTPPRRSSYTKSRAMVIAASQTIIAPSAWARTDQEYGEPFWALMERAISSYRAATPSLIRVTTAIRSSTVIRGQGPSSKARRAAATARSTSAAEACGTRPMTSSVCGETTSMTSSPSGSVNSPPMYSFPCSTSSVMTAASRGEGIP